MEKLLKRRATLTLAAFITAFLVQPLDMVGIGEGVASLIPQDETMFGIPTHILAENAVDTAIAGAIGYFVARYIMNRAVSFAKKSAVDFENA